MSSKPTLDYESRAQDLVAAGRFKDVEEVLQAGVVALEENEVWTRYAQGRIQAGLDDIAAGRTISSDEFLAQLRRGRLKQA